MALADNKDEAFFSANDAAHSSRKSSKSVTNEGVQKAAGTLKGFDHCRATHVTCRLDAQRKKLELPILPTTTCGSYPRTMDLRKVRRDFKANKISEDEYLKYIKEEISKVVHLQEELDLDVLVHGEAENMTRRPMKGMLTGPVTMLNWSFVRDDQPRYETCYQIALAIKEEVEDLEKAGIGIIQIDEAALREGLPLRKSEQAFYLQWAVHSFRITNYNVQETTQIHTHM